ncbi:MAG: ankyrin repeat domain-containing protein, partial [Pseudomonadota bacterium]
PRRQGLDDAAISRETFSLGDAQLTIAREYGYASWPRLKTIVAEQSGQSPELIHNDRIVDAAFRQAVDLVDEGNEAELKAHLDRHPDLIGKTVLFEGDNYFTRPTLIEFVAENPVRQGQLPGNIVAIAKLILDAGAHDNKEALNRTVALVASGRVPREAGVQSALIETLCHAGADPNAGLLPALSHGEFDAARALLACGADRNLFAVVALDDMKQVAQRLHNATSEQLQIALALAALHGRTDMIERLLKAGADPNRFNPEGVHSHCTPLHSAALAGHFETVKALVASGARTDIRDIHHSATAKDWANHAGHKNIVDFLNGLGS